MLDLLFLLVLTAWAALVGRRLLGGFGGPAPDTLETIALTVPLGLGVLGLATLGLGEVGCLNRLGLLAVLGLGLLVSGPEIRQWPGRPRFRLDPSPLALCFALALALTLLATLLCSLVPVTDGDALCYHLQVPKVFLQQGSVSFDPDLHETVYPLLVEMVYAVALEFRGPVACRLVKWLLGVSFAAAVALVARPWLGERARWAGTLALLVPAVSNGMSAPLNDVALAAYGMAALAAWVRWLDRPTLRAAALVGVFAGLAAGVKYPALVWAAVLGGSMVAARFVHRPALLRHAVLYSAVFLTVGCAWYARAYAHTGNPVHPFFRHAFGGAGLDEVLDPIKRPMDPTPWNLLTALAPMTLQPDRFDSFSHQFGPAFLMFLPILLLARPPARLGAVVAMGYAFLLICLTQRQSMRFVLIAVGPMAVGVAWLAAKWADRGTAPARLLCVGLALVLVFQAGLAGARVRKGIGAAIGIESSDDYLARNEPTYPIGQWVGSRLPADARLIGQEHRGFYFPRPYTMELAHRRRTGLGTHGESAEAIVETFRARGFTHLLMAPPIPEDAVEFDPTLGDRLAPWLARQVPLHTRAIRDPDGVTRRYAIYDLSTPSAVLAQSPGEPR
jgi:hypothetical protein